MSLCASVLPMAGENVKSPLAISRVVEYPITVTVSPPPVFENATDSITGTPLAIVAAAAAGGGNVVPGELSCVAIVIVPATVPVARTGAVAGASDPAGIVSDTFRLPPPEVMNCTV